MTKIELEKIIVDEIFEPLHQYFYAFFKNEFLRYEEGIAYDNTLYFDKTKYRIKSILNNINNLLKKEDGNLEQLLFIFNAHIETLYTMTDLTRYPYNNFFEKALLIYTYRIQIIFYSIVLKYIQNYTKNKLYFVICKIEKEIFEEFNVLAEDFPYIMKNMDIEKIWKKKPINSWLRKKKK